MQTAFSYYEILGVERTATQEQIKVAYRAAMLKYHPDVNGAPNAQRLTEMLNEAYEVLSDPATRRHYDGLPDGARSTDSQEPANQEWPFFTCDECHKVDVHLRCAVFYKVFSVVIFSQTKATGGVLCPQCRSNVAISSAVFSAFLGPWGFPGGIAYTLRSLFASLRGGELPRQQNAQLLRHQGIAFLQRGLLNEARTALTASLRFEKSQQVVELLKQSRFSLSTVFPEPRWSQGQTTAAFLFAVPPVLLVILFLWLGFGSQTAGPSSGLSSPAATDQAQYDQFKGILKGCAAANGKHEPAKAYDACNSAIEWLDDDQKKSPVGSKEFQTYALLIDSARSYQGLAAVRLGWKDKARELITSSAAGFDTLRKRGVTADIRRQANTAYSCLMNDKC